MVGTPLFAIANKCLTYCDTIRYSEKIKNYSINNMSLKFQKISFWIMNKIIQTLLVLNWVALVFLKYSLVPV